MNKKIVAGFLASISLFSLVGIANLTACAFNDNSEDSSKVIQEKISEVEEKLEAASTMADSARTLGVDESDYIIWFAKSQWTEYNEQLNILNQEYKAAKEKENKGKNLGEFKITYYCTDSCCNGNYDKTAMGTTITPGVTVAVDPNVIPLGSNVYIEGEGNFQAQDTGGKIKGNRIDIAVASHEEALSKGVTYATVYVK